MSGRIPEGYVLVETERHCYVCHAPLAAFKRANKDGEPTNGPQYDIPCRQCWAARAPGIMHPFGGTADAAAFVRGIPERYQQWSLGDYSQGIADAVKGFLAGDLWCLYLHGRPGTKKSSLAAAALIHWRSQAGTPQGAFIGMAAFTAAVRDPGRRPFLHTWRKSPFLVLDDVGSARNTPGVTESLVSLLSWRYGRMRQTIITSNLDPDDLATHVDERIASRIHDGVVLDLGDRDVRLELAGAEAT